MTTVAAEHKIHTNNDNSEFIGKRFGLLVVSCPVDPEKNRRRDKWLCECDCGRRSSPILQNLIKGVTKSCGCLRKTTPGTTHKTHGLSGTRVYNIWRDMNRRCFDSAAINYKDYGGRGIVVCERWRALENFFADMGHPPEGTSLDRIDNDGHYEPSNCVWSTRLIQARNRRNNIKIIYRGISYNVYDLADLLNMDHKTIRQLARTEYVLDPESLSKPTQS